MKAIANQVFSKEELLEHWQGHRMLTRKVIEAFPEKDLFEFSIGGMRTFADMAKELLAIAAPGLRQIVLGTTEKLEEEMDLHHSKEKLLALWDESTEELNELWKNLDESRFREEILTFGVYPGTVWSSINYFIDNEIHHRGQGYVYLRALGIEPPAFWDR